MLPITERGPPYTEAKELRKSQLRAGGRVNTAGQGEGRRRGRWQLGELKYADGEMCECLGERKDPDPKE